MLNRIEHERVLELQLDHPPANALTPELIAALGQAVEAAPGEGFEALVLSGREGMFSAGLDVPHFLSLDRNGVKQAWLDFFELMKALAASPIPTVAALTGHAPAGGCVISLFCDWRIMAEGKFKIGLNEVQVGLRMPVPIAMAARYVVGPRQAERLCAQATLLPVEEAWRIGLVDELAPLDSVTQRAVEWAKQQLELPPAALAKTRAIVRADLCAPFRRIDDDQLEVLMDEWFSTETQDSMRALVERIGKK